MIAITGSKGFIGTNLKNYFYKDYPILSIDRNHEETVGAIPKYDYGPIDGPKIVIHLAATNSIGFCQNNPLDVMRDNIDFFIETYKRFSKSCKLFIYASSSSVYAESDHFSDTTVLREPKTLYGRSKLANEIMAEILAKQYGIQTIGLRFFNVFGPHQEYRGEERSAFVPKVLNAMLNGGEIKLYNNGENRRDFTPVSYLCLMIDHLIRNHDKIKDLHKVLNLGATEAMRVKYMYTAIENMALKFGLPNNATTTLAERRDWERTVSQADMSSWHQIVPPDILDNVRMHEEIKKTVEWFKETYNP